MATNRDRTALAERRLIQSTRRIEAQRVRIGYGKRTTNVEPAVKPFASARGLPKANTGLAGNRSRPRYVECNGCSLLSVEANSTSYSDLASAVNRAAALGAHVISNSYGGSEAGTSTYEPYCQYVGIAVTVSSGDSGYGVQFPASSPPVTAVGGTSLVRRGSTRGRNESAWSGAGSGCSSVYSKPSWQTDSGCVRRTVADVSAVADPNTGVAVYGPSNGSRSAWMVFGGTSVAAPLVAGLCGLKDTAVTYGSDPYHHTDSLFDVTSGSNGSCSGTYLCTAVSGYDGPTGLGTPNGTAAFGN